MGKIALIFCFRRFASPAASRWARRAAFAPAAGARSPFWTVPAAPVAACPFPSIPATALCAPPAWRARPPMTGARAISPMTKTAAARSWRSNMPTGWIWCRALRAGWNAPGAPLLAESDLIVPVPLHRWRLWRRRYNQAAELARALARRSGKPCRSPGAGARSGLHPARARWFRPGPAAAMCWARFGFPNSGRVAGRNILLIDDVLTTGATAEAAARALKRAGAAKVHGPGAGPRCPGGGNAYITSMADCPEGRDSD